MTGRTAIMHPRAFLTEEAALQFENADEVLSDLESEREDLENELTELEQQIADMKREIETAKRRENDVRTVLQENLQEWLRAYDETPEGDDVIAPVAVSEFGRELVKEIEALH